MNIKATLAILLLTATILLPHTNAQAQFITPKASKVSIQHAKIVSKACIGNWESQPCLKAVSESALVFAANYGAKLKRRGKSKSMETLKQHCAAATAASQGEYPAYAMQSAYTECANIIYDISEETKVTPDQSHYQLLVAPVLCLSKARECKGIESGLKKYTR